MELQVGSRVSVKTQLATVRWLGELLGRQGRWVGVEWDDANRGKHSGQIEGVSYFCTKHPGAGSFLKEDSLNETLDATVCISYAITDKYADNSEQDISELYVSTTMNRRKPIELLGVEKILARQEQLHQLNEIALQCKCVSHINAGFGGVLANCEILLLDINLLDSWEQVNMILRELPQLRTLSLSHNRILYGELTVAHSLGTLVLNSMDLTWGEVFPPLGCFPALQELHLYDNLCSDICLPEGMLSNLKLLNLEHNRISSWEMISGNFAALPALSKLILNANCLGYINYSGGFAALTALSIERNLLDNWNSVEELYKFPAGIKELRLSGNSSLQQTMQVSLFRFMVIARIGTLVHLNGSLVRPTERTDAERYFLRSNVNHLETQNTERWRELVAVHGDPNEIGSRVVTEQETAKGQTLLSSSVSVLLRSLTSATVGKETRKKLALSMDVGALKALCSKLFSVDIARMKLAYRESKEMFVPEILEDDLKDLNYYMLKDGGEIWVEEST